MNINQLFTVFNKVVLITESGNGVAQALIFGFSLAGAKVICLDSGENSTQQVVRKMNMIGGNCVHISVDLSDQESVIATVKRVFQENGKVDVCINNCGVVRNCNSALLSQKEFDELLEKLISTTLRTSQLIGKAMSEFDGGKIINIPSIIPKIYESGPYAYHSTRKSVFHQTRSLAAEWASLNIQVNSIDPGFVARENYDRFYHELEKDDLSLNASHMPFGKWCRPEQLIGSEIYLSSTASSHITGTVLTMESTESVFVES